MRHILVPTDFSETARTAFEHALELCQDPHDRITLLHVSDTENFTETLIGLDAIGYLSNTLELPSMSTGCTPSFDVDELKIATQQRLEECIDATWRRELQLRRPLKLDVRHSRS